MSSHRQLAAIMFTDIVGFTAMMQRSEEQAVTRSKAITSLILRENKRLITLLGPGGMEKTRLSVKVAELLADELKHGVCLVALDMVTDHEQVPLYIIIAWGSKSDLTIPGRRRSLTS